VEARVQILLGLQAKPQVRSLTPTDRRLGGVSMVTAAADEDQPNRLGHKLRPTAAVLGERPTDVLHRPVPEGSRPRTVGGEEHLVSGTGEDQEGRAGLVGDAEAHGHVAAHE
jgi:hypothetical protein